MASASAFMADWLVVLGEATVRGSAIIMVAAAIAWLLRRRAAALRSVLWHAVVCAILALPLLSEVLPRWRVEVPDIIGAPPAAIASRLGGRERLPAVESPATRREAPASERTTLAPIGDRGGGPNADERIRIVVAALFTLWALGALVMVGQLLLSMVRVARIERRARIVAPETIAIRVGSVVDGESIRRVRVLEGPPHIAPMTWGILRPRVLMPAGWERWPVHVAAAVLAHELAHVRRGDLARQLPWDIARVLYWFNPLIAIAASQAHLAREQACDDDVVDRGLSATTYADALLVLVRELRGTRLARVPALGGSGESELAKRIAAMVDPTRARRSSRVAAAVAAMLLAMVSVATASVAFATTADNEAMVDGETGRALDSAFTVLGARGLSGTVLVATDHGVVFAKGYGYADRSRQIPATVGTRYPVAGIAKALTAAAAVDLIDRGFISAHAPVGRYLPELGERAGQVTVHQLLTHTDGLGDPGPISPGADASAFLFALGSRAPSFAPGSSYRSTDIGHSVLAALIERVTGQPFDAYLTARVLEPAGMASSSFQFGRELTPSRVAVGYTGTTGGDSVPARTAEWGGRGSRGLVTTVHDLHRWYTALTSGRLVRQSALDLMFTPYWRTEKPFEQGYGWLLYDDRAVLPFRNGPIPVRRRSGREPGFEAEMVHDPNGAWFAVVLLNADDGRRLDAIDAIRLVMNAHPPPTSATR